MLTAGFSWAQAKSRAVPMISPTSIRPRCNRLRELLMAPDSSSGSMWSTRSECTPRSRFPASASITACGMRPDAHLDGGAVGNELGHLGGDPPLHLPHCGGRIFRERLLDLHEAVYLGPVEERVAESARHARVHLGDDQRRAPRGHQRVAHRDSEREPPATVGRRRVDHHRVGSPGASRGEQATVSK